MGAIRNPEAGLHGGAEDASRRSRGYSAGSPLTHFTSMWRHSLYRSIERVQFSIVPGARLFSLGKRILTRHPCESPLVFYRRKSPQINKRVHFLTKSAKKCPPPTPPHHPHAFFVWAAAGRPPGPARTASWRRTRVRVRGVPVHGM